MQNINNHSLITYNPKAFFSQLDNSNLTEEDIETKKTLESAIEAHKSFIKKMNIFFAYQHALFCLDDYFVFKLREVKVILERNPEENICQEDRDFIFGSNFFKLINYFDDFNENGPFRVTPYIEEYKIDYKRFSSSTCYASKQINFLKNISVVPGMFLNKTLEEIGFTDIVDQVDDQIRNIKFVYNALVAQGSTPAHVTKTQEEEIEELREKIKELKRITEENLPKKNIFQSFLETINRIFTSITSIFFQIR